MTILQKLLGRRKKKLYSTAPVGSYKYAQGGGLLI
jgi:hypothetical protein